MAPPDYKFEIIDPIKDRLPYIISALPFASGHWLTYYIDQFPGFAESSLLYRHQFKDQEFIKHCQSPHEIRGHPKDYHIHHIITASMKATMVRNIDFEKIALLENNWGPYVLDTMDRYLEFKKINPKLKMIVSMDIIHCRFELAKKYQRDISPEISNKKWELWQEKFGNDVFRININKVLEADERHMYELIAFLETDVNPDWRRLITDYRKHINV
tara:strand:+ start:4286 stop:4930 length:645 start_codon:yes stop_codon:yes gene_type:complete